VRVIERTEIGKILFKASRRLPGLPARNAPLEYAEPDPRDMAPPDRRKKRPKAKGPASERMRKLADDLKAANPKLSDSQAFVKVYTSREHIALKEAVKLEEMGVNA
jgi:hypothetical protein